MLKTAAKIQNKNKNKSGKFSHVISPRSLQQEVIMDGSQQRGRKFRFIFLSLTCSTIFLSVCKKNKYIYIHTRYGICFDSELTVRWAGLLIAVFLKYMAERDCS